MSRNVSGRSARRCNRPQLAKLPHYPGSQSVTQYYAEGLFLFFNAPKNDVVDYDAYSRLQTRCPAVTAALLSPREPSSVRPQRR
jgi:hypothetical protein